MSPKDASPPLADGQRWEYAYQGRFDDVMPSVWVFTDVTDYEFTATPLEPDRFDQFTMPVEMFERDRHMWRLVSEETRLDNTSKVVVSFLRRKGGDGGG